MQTQQVRAKYDRFVQKMKQKADVEFSIGILSWDKEVYMPPQGAGFRAQQIATLTGLAHELFTNNEFSDLLAALGDEQSNLPPNAQKNIAITLKEHRRMTCFDQDFVIRRSRACSAAYDAWLKAREANDFALFKDALAAIVAIKQEEAALLGYEGHAYNALLEEFEPGYTAAMLDQLFADVKDKLVDFVKSIRQRPQLKDDFLRKHYPKQQQWDYSITILRQMGYNFEAGRQDWSPHPFTINFSPKDVRVTTRVDENDLANLLWSSIHEGGHALYEQGLPGEQYGLPLSRHISLGIHESQSRLWENNVGRSWSFWQSNYPQLQKVFSQQLGNISARDFYKGINKIEAGFIRTEADELHYHFHVLIRYELEKALLEGSLEVADLESAWNERYQAYLEVDVPDAKRGVLQDIHWAYGNIGYFPTYSLGSFYAAQFFQQAQKEIPNLQASIEAGDLSTLLTWLQQNIYQVGRKYTASELCEKLTGESLNFQYFYDYAVNKYEDLYFE
ncbi:MAG: carboxypeptidase M32 [Bacteroidota bacterium]